VIRIRLSGSMAVASALGFTACGSDDTQSAGSQAVASECNKFCTNVIAPLKCPVATSTPCQSACTNQFDTRVPAECRTQGLDKARCFANSSTSSWACSTSGGQAIGAADVCLNEIVTLEACKNPGDAG
jgi:hypothetical protein